MIEKPKRPKKIPNQDNKQPQSIQELIRRYDLDNTEIYDYLDSLVLQMNNKIQTVIDTQRKNLELAFPIGSTYITQENINPSTILGFGTWERSKGKVFVGLDENDANFNTIGKTGGETTHTLTVAEMPYHNHSIAVAGTRLDSNGDTIFRAQTYNAIGGEGFWDIGLARTGSGTHDANITNTGENQPHNNLQPYEVVGYMWIRRA